MPNLEIQRTNENKNRIRACNIYMNGNKIGSILNGETKYFDIAQGSHVFVCKMDWWSSNSVLVEFANKEIKGLVVSNYKHKSWVMPLFIIMFLVFQISIPTLVPWFKNNISDYIFLYYLIIPILALLIIFFTIGRKKFVTLEELKSRR